MASMTIMNKNALNEGVKEAEFMLHYCLFKRTVDKLVNYLDVYQHLPQKFTVTISCSHDCFCTCVRRYDYRY